MKKTTFHLLLSTSPDASESESDFFRFPMYGCAQSKTIIVTIFGFFWCAHFNSIQEPTYKEFKGLSKTMKIFFVGRPPSTNCTQKKQKSLQLLTCFGRTSIFLRFTRYFARNNAIIRLLIVKILKTLAYIYF